MILKNKKEWEKWAKDAGLLCQDDTNGPIEYPCFAYTTVRSFGYEEVNENYLYRINLEEMLAEMRD